MLFYLHTEALLFSLSIFSPLYYHDRTVSAAYYLFPFVCSHAYLNRKGKPSASTRLLFYRPITSVFLFSHLHPFLTCTVPFVTSDTDAYEIGKCALNPTTMILHVYVVGVGGAGPG